MKEKTKETVKAVLAGACYFLAAAAIVNIALMIIWACADAGIPM